MSADEWELSEISATLTTYIAGIEDTLKDPITGALAYLDEQILEVYEGIDPILELALEAADVNLPGE